MKKIIFASLFMAVSQAPCGAQEKVLYDQDMGPETQVCDPIPEKPKIDYAERDQDFDELPPEADWPSRHDDPYPEELILDIHN